jgi:protein SCO1/2
MNRRLLMTFAALSSLGSGYSGPPQPRAGPPKPPPPAGIDQRLGVMVPLNLPFKDEAGHAITLSECVGGKPTVLVLAYYRCPMLCTQVLNGLLRALRAMPGDVGSTFNVVVVSIDPREKPPLAAVKKATYVGEYGRPNAETGWHFLTGDPLAIASLADAVGFRYQYDAETEQYAHGSGLIVLGPSGTISRYLLGVRFEPRDLRLALAEAAEGRVGTPSDQALLLCFRYDPATGAYTFTIIKIVRLLSAIAVLGVAGLVCFLAWKSRGRQLAAAAKSEG